MINQSFFLKTTRCCLNGRANLDTGFAEDRVVIDLIFLSGNCLEICSSNCLWFLKPLNTRDFTIFNIEKHTLNNFLFFGEVQNFLNQEWNIK